jgi:DNA polymerase-3 subunit epsilon
MRFIAIDVETANVNMASICSIGAAVFEGGVMTDKWYSLVDPKDYFDGVNISIHGIDETQVMGAPTFKEVAEKIDQLVSGNVVVTHTHFDRVAMHQAALRWTVPPLACTWLDSARVARRTWAECARRGYGLSDVCKRIGYSFEHHNALEDAKASGQVMLAAMRDAMLNRVTQPVGGSIKRDGNPDGSLAGEVVVFTGALDIPRHEAADLAASIGCAVGSTVTKKTKLLVVGDTDIARLAGHSKSSKHRKAEEMAMQGHPIRIIRETDFRELIEQA